MIVGVARNITSKNLNLMLDFLIACLPQLLKDFYLLGRGEVFRSLIENSKDLLKVPPTANTGNSKYIINSLFPRTNVASVSNAVKNIDYFTG